MSDNVRSMLEDLASGDVMYLAFVAIPDVEAYRERIEEEAAAMEVEIVIRDCTDAWLPIREDTLLVFRFADYAVAWGLPSADIRP